MKVNNDKTYAVIYARVSTKKQSSYGDSLGDQLKAMERHCKDKGWIVLETFKEQYTGTVGNRPAIERAYEFITKKKKEGIQIHYFVIHKMDRGSRGGAEVHTAIKRHLKSLGTKMMDVEGVMQEEREVVSVEGMNVASYDWAISSPSEMAEQMMATSKKQERDEILKRTIPKEIELSLEGYWTRPPTFGYNNKKVVIGGKKRVIQVPHEIEGEWIKTMFKLRSEGHRDEHIVDELNNMGYKSREKHRWNDTYTEAIGTKGGNKLTIKQLQVCIKNPIYAGIAVLNWRGNETKIVIEKYSGLVSIDLWNAANRGKKKIVIENGTARIFEKDITAQKIEGEKFVENPEIKRRNRDNPEYPFGKLVYADNASKAYFSGNAPKGNNGRRYEYYSARVGKKVINHSKNDFESTIINFFGELEPDKGFLNLYMDLLSRLWKERSNSLKDNKYAKQDRLSELQQQKSGLLKELSYFSELKLGDILIEKNKDLESLNLEIKSVEKDLEKDIQAMSITNVQNYGKALIENLGYLASNTRKNDVFKLMFKVISNKVPTYTEIVNRNLPLRPIFALSSHQKSPPDDELSGNLYWQPRRESNSDRRIWNPEF